MDNVFGLVVLVFGAIAALLVWWVRRRRFQRALTGQATSNQASCLLCHSDSAETSLGCPQCGHQIDASDPRTEEHREFLRDLFRARDTLVAGRELSSGISTSGDWVDFVASFSSWLFTRRRRRVSGLTTFGNNVSDHHQEEGHDEVMRGLRQVADLLNDYPDIARLSLDGHGDATVLDHLEYLFNVDDTDGSLLKEAMVGHRMGAAIRQAKDAGEAVERLDTVHETVVQDLLRRQP